MVKNTNKADKTAMENTGYNQAGSQIDLNNHQVPQTYGPMYQADQWNKEQTKSGGFFIGTLIGGVVGATAALMLAPKTGKEMQAGIKTQTAKLKEKAAEKKNSDGPGLTQQIKDQSTKVVDKVKNLKTGNTPMDDGTASSEGEEGEELMDNQNASNQKLDTVPVTNPASSNQAEQKNQNNQNNKNN